MKYSVLIIALLLACSYAVGTHRTLTNAQIRKIDNLKQGNTWASFLINLAEMHVLAQGPLDDLVAAIEDVLSDLSNKLDSANAEYDRRTQEHSSETRRLTDLINESSRNIAETQELIDNVLIPQKNQLNEELVNLNQEIEATKAHIEQATTSRQNAHSDYLARVDEHNNALAAVSEALQILGQLNSQDTSLIQLKKFHKSIDKLQTTMKGKKNVETTLIKSLLQLTNNGFADQEGIQKVTELLLTVKSNLEESLQREGSEEDTAQREFESDVIRSHQYIQDCNAAISQKSEELARTEESIAQAHQYIDQRTADKASYEKDLQNENDAFDLATTNYNDLVAQLNAEQTACSEALDVVKNATIEDYIGGRVSQTSDHVIDTNHGSGVRTGVEYV